MNLSTRAAEQERADPACWAVLPGHRAAPGAGRRPGKGRSAPLGQTVPVRARSPEPARRRARRREDGAGGRRETRKSRPFDLCSAPTAARAEVSWMNEIAPPLSQAQRS